MTRLERLKKIVGWVTYPFEEDLCDSFVNYSSTLQTWITRIFKDQSPPPPTYSSTFVLGSPKIALGLGQTSTFLPCLHKSSLTAVYSVVAVPLTTYSVAEVFKECTCINQTKCGHASHESFARTTLVNCNDFLPFGPIGT